MVRAVREPPLHARFHPDSVYADTRQMNMNIVLCHKQRLLRSLICGVCLLMLWGCSLTPAQVSEQNTPASPPTAPVPSPTTTTTPGSTSTPRPTATATIAILPTSTSLPPTATSVPTPDPVAGLTIPDLRGRSYGGGSIVIGEVYNYGTGYTTYRIGYPADDLQLTGLLHVPDGTGPFPLIIANRGHIDPERYQPGMDSRAFSDLMARNGYLVVAPDYRGYGGGDAGPNPFYTGYYADVLHLIPLAQALPMAQPGKVGMWGHSRGASITVAALTITDQIAAAVVYAPAPADLAVDYARRYQQSGGNPGSEVWPFPPDADPQAYARVSPINYFDQVNAPVMLHHGSADTVVDASASVAIADALQAAGKDVTLHLYEAGGHTLQGADDQLYAARTLEFFRMHMEGQ